MNIGTSPGAMPAKLLVRARDRNGWIGERRGRRGPVGGRDVGSDRGIASLLKRDDQAEGGDEFGEPLRGTIARF